MTNECMESDPKLLLIRERHLNHREIPSYICRMKKKTEETDNTMRCQECWVTGLLVEM